MNSYKLFQVGEDRPEYIVSENKSSAMLDYNKRSEFPCAIEEIKEIPLNTVANFEMEHGGYEEMTFQEYIDKNFSEINLPQLICWND